MRVTNHSNADDFLNCARSFLEHDEAANGLALAVATRLSRQPETPNPGPILMTADENGAVVLAAVMMPPHNLVLSGAGPRAPEAVALVVREVGAGGWTPSGVIGPPDIAQAFAENWTQVSGVPHDLGMRHRIYALTAVVHPRYSPGELRPAADSDLDLVADWFTAFRTEVFREPADPQQAREAAATRVRAGDVFLWEDGKVVSMAAKDRPTTHGMTVNQVYTPPEFRNRGYAASCVARLSQTLLDSGRAFCCLYADLENPISNAIYQKIGYKPVCDALDFRFGPKPS